MSMDSIGENINCLSFGVKPGTFPCDANPIQAISMGIATGGVALLFSVFLFKNVRIVQLENILDRRKQQTSLSAESVRYL